MVTYQDYPLDVPMNLIHYIIVRKDLPLGVLAAMITHAAGESAALYQDPYDGRFRGATAVVLEVENEIRLIETANYLAEKDIQHVDIRESGGPYHGQRMAVGVVPGDRDVLFPYLSTYPILKEPIGPVWVDEEGDRCNCSNCRGLDKAKPSR